MPNRYRRIKFPKSSPFDRYTCDDTDSLGNLSLVNIFIGPNNSGKSRLLRSVFSLGSYTYALRRFDASSFRDLVNETRTKLVSVLTTENSLRSRNQIDHRLFDDIIEQDLEFIDSSQPFSYELFQDRLERLKDAGRDNLPGPQFMGEVDVHQLDSSFQQIGREGLQQLQSIEFDPGVGGAKRYYIPILRGMRPLDDQQSNLYRERTIKDYFIDSNGNTTLPSTAEVFTGIELYQRLKEMLLGEPQQRDAIRQYEELLSKRFFQGKTIALIPREGDNTVHIKIGDEPQLPIFQLGDGLQSLLICTLNICLEEARSLFFLEEPDMCMHPSLQRSFLEILTKFPQHQYFITTHSNHFLDMAMDFPDMSVFRFRKIVQEDPQFQISTALPRDRDILLDLGVRNSSVYLTNSTIWVEGITDRLYLRCYMSKYVEQLKDTDSEKADAFAEFKEDYHYSFVEYQGSNLVHWTFDVSDPDAKRIHATFMCANPLLIADGDIASKGNRKQFYENMLGDKFILLRQKEIENLLPEAVLQKIVTEECDTNDWIPRLVKFKDYAKARKPLGRYLDSLLELDDGKRVFAAASGTISNKGAFCDDAIKIMSDPKFTWELNDDLNDLCARIFKHIAEQNQ